MPYKSLDELDRQRDEKQRLVDSGTLKIVDEKKLLGEISAMTKQRKTFASFDDGQKQIDQLRAKVKEIRDTAEDPEQKALSERYNTLQKELDGIKAQSDEAYKSLGALRDERSRLKADQDEKYATIRKLKDDFYGQRRAFQSYEREARDRARERQRAERERIQKERKKADAERFLQEASDPAFLEEIRRANSLLRFLDPSAAEAAKGPLLADSGLAAEAQRKVDDSAPQGMKLVRKEDREDDYLAPTVKKGKKGKKGQGAADAATKFNCPPSVVQDCAYLGVEPPMSAAEVPTVVEKVQAKLAEWRANQQAQTTKVSALQPWTVLEAGGVFVGRLLTMGTQNVEKAKKELARLELEDGETADGEPKAEAQEETAKAE